MKFASSLFLLLKAGSLVVHITAAQDQDQVRVKLPLAGAGKDPFGLSKCLREAFGDATVNYAGDDILPKVVFSPANAAKDFSLEDYNTARGIAWRGSSLPGAILFVEKTQDVIDGVNCAREHGYVVAPRGSGHSYQASSTADGTLVIDMKLTCTPDNFEVVSKEQGDGILPGSKYAGIIRAASGCTNAALLAAVDANYDSEVGAMVVVGTCPSVGITGYLLGGGQGDVTPYAGLGSDQVKAFDIVLFDGTEIKASPDENEDLYWAARGGGGGFGVITNLYLQNVISPSPTAFTYMVMYKKGTPEVQGEYAVRFQNFLYDDPNSPKFGGGSVVVATSGIYLGPWEEAVETFANAGLLDDELLSNFGQSMVMKDFNVVCNNADNNSSSCDAIKSVNIPQFGIGLYEVKTLAEAEALVFSFTYYIDIGQSTSAIGRSLNVCEDLGIDDSFCTVAPSYSTDMFADGQPCAGKGISCMHNFVKDNKLYTKEVVDGLLAQAPDITSMLNQHGIVPSVRKAIDALDPPAESSSLGNNYKDIATYGYQSLIGDWPKAKDGEIPTIGGLALPRLTDETMRKIGEAGENTWNHLSHGANLVADKSASAYPWRNAAWCTGHSKLPLDIILKDPYFNNDPDKLPGYYAYLGSASMPNFRKMYWNDTTTMTRLSAVRAKYDPTGGFDNPHYIPRGIDFGGAETECENKDTPNNETYPVTTPVTDPVVSQNNKPTDGEACASITEIACGVADFSTLCSLVSSFSGLADDLSVGSWTVFAPTNDAFARLNKELNGGLKSVSDDLLMQILQFHAVDGQKLYADDFSCVSGAANLIAMSNSKDARIKCKNGTPFGIKGKGNEEPADFVDVNVEACNGVIHAIDDVLLFK